MSKGHRHAALMAEYARIAAEHEKPWEFFEFRSEDDKSWTDCNNHVIWLDYLKYRLKPRTIRIGEIDVPEPMRSAPEAGSCYFFLALTGSGMVVESEWGGNWVDELSLSRGICHTTKEAAIAHAKALILVSGGKV